MWFLRGGVSHSFRFSEQCTKYVNATGYLEEGESGTQTISSLHIQEGKLEWSMCFLYFARGRHTGRGELKVVSVCSVGSSEVLAWGQILPYTPLLPSSGIHSLLTVLATIPFSSNGVTVVDGLSQLQGSRGHFACQFGFQPLLRTSLLERHPWTCLSGQPASVLRGYPSTQRFLGSAFPTFLEILSELGGPWKTQRCLGVEPCWFISSP